MAQARPAPHPFNINAKGDQENTDMAPSAAAFPVSVVSHRIRMASMLNRDGHNLRIEESIAVTSTANRPGNW